MYDRRGEEKKTGRGRSWAAAREYGRQGEAADGKGATEHDDDLAGLAVEVLAGGADAVDLNLREVASEEVADELAKVIVGVGGFGAHERAYAVQAYEDLAPGVGRHRFPVSAGRATSV
jgi:hypothetical protein